MAPAAPFNPPSSTLAGKPSVPQWVPPPVTKETHNFAQLKSIDLSLLDSEDPAVVDSLVQNVKQAIRDDGFLFLENYGVSLDQVRVYVSISERIGLTIAIATSPVRSSTVLIQKYERGRQGAAPVQS
jgi:hypothetical protein